MKKVVAIVFSIIILFFVTACDNSTSQGTMYHVVFKDGTDIVFEQSVNAGNSINMPIIELNREGFDFTGWIIDGSNSIVSFPMTIENDITLIAKFTQKPQVLINSISDFNSYFNVEFKQVYTPPQVLIQLGLLM